MERKWTEIITLYNYNPVGWDVLFALLAILFISHYFPSRFEFNKYGWEAFIPRGRGRMLKRARWNFVVAQAINDFTHAVEERVYNGEYTRKEASELYREARKTFHPVKDFFPSPELLKEAIRRRRALGIHDPVPLPLREVPPKKKHMFEK